MIEAAFTYPPITTLMVICEFLVVFLLLVSLSFFTDKAFEWMGGILSVVLICGAIQVLYVAAKTDIMTHIWMIIFIFGIWGLGIVFLQAVFRSKDTGVFIDTLFGNN